MTLDERIAKIDAAMAQVKAQSENLSRQFEQLKGSKAVLMDFQQRGVVLVEPEAEPVPEEEKRSVPAN